MTDIDRTGGAGELRKNRIEKRDEYRKQRLNVVISSGESALRTAFLVNGGGAGALLAFFGQMSKQNLPAAAWVVNALLALIVGTAVAAVATGISFLPQYGCMMDGVDQNSAGSHAASQPRTLFW